VVTRRRLTQTSRISVLFTKGVGTVQNPATDPDPDAPQEREVDYECELAWSSAKRQDISKKNALEHVWAILAATM